MSISRYEDLVVWQLANEFKVAVYALIDHSAASDDRSFCDQLRKAASSAPANIAEGFAAYLHPEFARYLRIARRSLLEAHSHVRDGVDRRYWSSDDAGIALMLADRAIGATTRLLRYLLSSKTPAGPLRRP